MDLYNWVSANRFVSVFLALLLYYLGRTIYRLYFHPLAKFPGPKLAAASRWYEFYFEIVKGGMWTTQIEMMHEEYGPIIRINPFELHVNDPDFYDALYNFNPQLDKRQFYVIMGSPENLQHTADSSLHKLRRRSFDPFFSRQSVTRLEWEIKDGVRKMVKRMAEAHRERQPINVSLLYRCLTADVISQYAFAQSYGFLDNPAESASFFSAHQNVFRNIWFVREVPLVATTLDLMGKLPQWLLPKDKGMSAVMKWQASIRERVQQAFSPDFKPAAENEYKTIFQEYRQAKLPAEEKSERRVLDNAVMLVGAGFETTGFTLSTAHYHLLANPSICERLKRELEEAWPVVYTGLPMPEWTALEKLPYLKAIIQESLRMSVGVMSRLPRVNHHSTMRYRDWVIPRHTPVGMSQSLIHFNSTIFPDPWKFCPERWLQGEKSKKLEKYLVSFSRGSRSCIGMHLAQAELHLALANMFHHFDMELYETTRRDVDAKFDFFVPSADPDSKGVRVIVK